MIINTESHGYPELLKLLPEFERQHNLFSAMKGGLHLGFGAVQAEMNLRERINTRLYSLHLTYPDLFQGIAEYGNNVQIRVNDTLTATISACHESELITPKRDWMSRNWREKPQAQWVKTGKIKFIGMVDGEY